MAKVKLSDLTVEALKAEIARRQKSVKKLEAKRARLARQLKKLDAEIAAAGGTVEATAAAAPARARRGNRKRAKNAMKLPEAMVKVMSTDKPLSVNQIADAVKKIGYVSNSATFNTIIYQTLAREKKLFQKVDRGQYTLKG